METKITKGRGLILYLYLYAGHVAEQMV